MADAAHMELAQTGIPTTALSAPLPADQHAAKFVSGAPRPGIPPHHAQALDTIAYLASSGTHDAETLGWAHLRYQRTNYTAAIRSLLAERYPAATANKTLSPPFAGLPAGRCSAR